MRKITHRRVKIKLAGDIKDLAVNSENQAIVRDILVKTCETQVQNLAMRQNYFTI